MRTLHTNKTYMIIALNNTEEVISLLAHINSLEQYYDELIAYNLLNMSMDIRDLELGQYESIKYFIVSYNQISDKEI